MPSSHQTSHTSQSSGKSRISTKVDASDAASVMSSRTGLTGTTLATQSSNMSGLTVTPCAHRPGQTHGEGSSNGSGMAGRFKDTLASAASIPKRGARKVVDKVFDVQRTEVSGASEREIQRRIAEIKALNPMAIVTVRHGKR